MKRPDTWGQKEWLKRPIVKAWIILNYADSTNPELAQTLNVGLTTLRNCLAELGLKRIEMEYWTPEQVEEMLALYPTKGDLEIAAIFQEKYPKNKLWTKKHIEKKRGYLGIKRTPAMLAHIHDQFLGNPTPERAHTFRQPAEVGEVRIFKGKRNHACAHTKCEDGRWRPLAPIVWAQHNGPIPKGFKVRLLDGDPTNCALENLQLIKAGDVPRLCFNPSRALSDKFVASMLAFRKPREVKDLYLATPELIEVKRNQLLLRRQLNDLKS